MSPSTEEKLNDGSVRNRSTVGLAASELMQNWNSLVLDAGKFKSGGGSTWKLPCGAKLELVQFDVDSFWIFPQDVRMIRNI